MGDCSTQAWNAPHGIDGAIHWNIGESELHYARFVNGEERKAEYVELDGVKFVPERGECEMKLVPTFYGWDYDKSWECSACGKQNDEQAPRFCPNCGAKVVDE